MRNSHLLFFSRLFVCLSIFGLGSCGHRKAAPPPSSVESLAPETSKEALRDEIATLSEQYEDVKSRVAENQQRIEALEKEIISLQGSSRGRLGRPSPDARWLYHTAFEAYFQGNYPIAVSLFQEFLNAFPPNDLTDNAFYWMGESYFAQEEFQRAISSFLTLVDRYPHGNNVPDALYKTGLSYTRLRNPQKAREFLTHVMDNYPFSEAAKKAKARLDELE
jgi:tol-pal system protein YbgF